MVYEVVHLEHGEADQIRFLKENEQTVGQRYGIIIIYNNFLYNNVGIVK